MEKEVIILRPEKSTYVTSRKPFFISCNSSTLPVGSLCASKFISYLYFDLSSLPSDLIIKSALLTLYFKAHPYKGIPPNTIIIHPLKNAFEDCETFFIDRPRNFAETKLIANYISESPKFEVTITEIFNRWYSQTLPNHGLSLSTSDLFNSGYLKFHSSNIIDISQQPTLTIETSVSKECDIVNTEEDLEVLSMNSYSSTREVWCFSVFSFIVKNTGINQILLTIQDSADGLDFIDEGPERSLLPGQSVILVNRFFARYARLKAD
ncbi:hypothetical protein N752_21780 [Desulforamulus aquiferis]|nr:DNRLRE domain-containing protein [Desulforamulus aquiferis]RYD03044.1 hypothetical protein N752_21780 [Desulforamulus aquiferis]